MLKGCRLFKQCPNLPARHCVAGVQAVQAVSRPTCQALCCRVAVCLSGVGTYLPGTVLQGCRLFKCCWNLPAWHCVAGLQAVSVMLEPTCWSLSCRCAVIFSSVITYLQGTVLHGCRLLKRCRNLPAGHCVEGVQAVKAVSEPTCQALCCRGAGCSSSVRTHMPGTVLQGSSLFKWCRNLLAGHCVAGVQAV